MSTLWRWAEVFLAYLVGSIPFAYLLAKLKGVDIRRVGSGNVGATNVFRCVSRPLGVLVFLLDAAKGFVPTWFALRHPVHSSFESLARALACGCTAVLGHTWPVWLRFHGGKGVATSTGVVLAVAPGAAAVGLVTWITVFVTGRYVSLASIIAAAGAAAAAWVLYPPTDLRPAVLTVIAALIVYRHRSNIRRLLNGSEPRLGRSQERNP